MKVINSQVKVGKKIYNHITGFKYSGGKIRFVDSEGKEHVVDKKYAKHKIIIDPEDRKSIFE